MKDNNVNVKTNTTWSKRFIVSSIVHASIISGLTIFLVLSQISLLKPAVSRVIAAGNAGMWFTVGYTMYIVIGVISMAIFGLYYYYIEEGTAKRSYYNNSSSRHKALVIMAWSNIVLMNAGTISAMTMLMYGGYNAGAAMLPVEVGGKGFTAAQAHTILGPLAEPISVSILVIAAGALIGIIGFVVSHIITTGKNEMSVRTPIQRGEEEQHHEKKIMHW